MIYNKSAHPIEVKKISIRIWSLRDEIEAAIGRRIKECEASGVPLYIDDIKSFYNFNLKSSLNQDNVLQLSPNATSDSSENVANLMESIKEEAKSEGEALPENSALNEADQIIAEQTKQGLETNRPNPIIQRPYQRQAPDLEKIRYGFMLLADISMDDMLSFTKDKFLHGQSVVIEFLIPQTFMLTADVTYCHHYALRSRIISSTKPDYRVQCKFSFSFEGERERLRNFVKSIVPTLPNDAKKSQKDSQEDSLDN